MATASVAPSTAEDAERILQPSEATKDTIDKVVQFLAKSPEMEARLVSEHGQNEKMSFLTPMSPYFAYYKQRLVEEKAKLAKVPEEEVVEEASEAPEPEKEVIVKPDDFQWLLPTKPSSIPSFDYDLIRIVAQYVARKGRAFQMGLWNRERSNSLYGFLSNHHPLHDLYQHLVSDYSRIILKEEPLISSHKPENVTRQNLLAKIRQRAAWKKSQLKSEEDKRAEEEAERTAAATVDWNDAIIVDTITFDPSQDAFLPAPIEQSKLLTVYLAAKQKEEEERARAQRAISSDPGFTAPLPSSGAAQVLPTTHITPMEPMTAADVQRGGPKKMTILCSICRRPFPIDEIEGHMKVEMAQGGAIAMNDMNRNRTKQPEFAPVVATGDDIADKLAKIAKRRTDIFGDEDDERAILEAQRAEREKKEKEAANAFAAVSYGAPYPPAQVENPNYMPPMHMGMISPPAGAVKAQNFVSGLPPPMQDFSGKRASTTTVEQLEETTAAKKSKTNEVIDLLPEKEFAAQNPGPVTLNVSQEDAESFEISIPVMSSVKALKDELVKKSNIPVNKQILKIEHLGFLKDKLTMAHYNVTSGTTLLLSTKERGGRKK